MKKQKDILKDLKEETRRSLDRYLLGRESEYGYTLSYLTILTEKKDYSMMCEFLRASCGLLKYVEDTISANKKAIMEMQCFNLSLKERRRIIEIMDSVGYFEFMPE